MRKSKTSFKTGKPKNKPSSELLVLPLCFGLLALTLPLASQADSAAASHNQRFHIAPQPLYSALNRLAEQAGVQFVYSAEMVKGLDSPGVSGNYSLSAALSKLLAGSGLGYQLGQGNTVTLQKMLIPVAAARTAEPQSAETLPTVTVSGKTEAYDDDPTNPRNKSYTVTNSSTATKTDTPIFDTPVSIQVVPRSVMDDQKSTRVKDALENVSGVRTQPTLGQGTGFIIRGFRSNQVYRNGLVADIDSNSQEFDTGNLQSIDVLKGPAAVLFGRVEPGGLVNITTKKPQATPYYSVEQQFGTFDHYRTQWDATGAVNKDESLMYRFSGAYQDSGSFRDFISTDRVLVNPSFTWKPDDKTDMTLNIEGFDQDYQADFGIPAIGTRPAPIPINRSLDDPNSPIDHISKAIVSTEINHRLNNDWAIHNRFYAGFTDTASHFVNPAPAFGPSSAALLPDGTLKRNVFGQTATSAVYSTNLDLTGKFKLGISSHETLMGFDYHESTQNYHYFGEFNTPNNALDINIYNPSYGIDPALINQTLANDPACCAGSNYATLKNEWKGVYFQDHITLWDKLHILGGGRYDWASSGSAYLGSFAEAEKALELADVEGFSPRVGVLYQPISWLGVYGNWTTSFSANNPTADDGTTFDPQTGEQFEAGFKTQLFDDRLLATLAYYHLTKDNILVNNTDTPFLFDKIANQQRSRGVELDVSGQLTNQLSLIGSYAYTDAIVTKDFDGGNQGHRLPNVAEHSGSLWVKFDVNGYQASKGFSFGLGGVAAGEREGDFGNSFQLPGFVRMDAFAAYKLVVNGAKVTTQFNIRNLLDKTYYDSTDPFANINPRLGIAPGAPLTAIGSIRVEY